MKTLTQTWELIQLLSSLRLLSPTLVRASNPQTYIFYCVYNPTNEDIDRCGDLSCDYYLRIVGNGAGGVMGLAISGGVCLGLIEIGATLAAPLTGGASLAAAMALTTISATGAAVGGGAVTLSGATATLNGIKNELKLKWENEQQEAEINNLQREIADLEINSETSEEEEVAAEEPRPWWDDVRENSENEVENETSYSERVRGEHEEAVRPNTTVFTSIPWEERLEMARMLSEFVEQSGGRDEFECEIESVDTNFSYYIRARRARRRRDN